MPDSPMERYHRTSQRLTNLRRALGKTQIDCARLLGVAHQRWSRWENGINQIGPLEAIKLKEAVPGLTLDWIYEGDIKDLSDDLLRRLVERT